LWATVVAAVVVAVAAAAVVGGGGGQGTWAGRGGMPVAHAMFHELAFWLKADVALSTAAVFESTMLPHVAAADVASVSHVVKAVEMLAVVMAVVMVMAVWEATSSDRSTARMDSRCKRRSRRLLPRTSCTGAGGPWCFTAAISASDMATTMNSLHAGSIFSWKICEAKTLSSPRWYERVKIAAKDGHCA
jgi:hypothetical protein